MLSNNQKNVLYALISDPVMNVNAITSYLNDQNIEVSYYSVNKAYSELLTSNILRQSKTISDSIVPGNDRTISHVEGNYIPQKLGLQRQHVIFRDLPSKESVSLFKRLCDLHPYTHYRSILVGQGIHAYAQFDLPPKSITIMEELFEIMKKKLEVNEFQIINHNRSTYSELKLRQYSSEDDNWKFSVFGDNLSLQKLWYNHTQVADHFLISQYQSQIDQLNAIEIDLIRELTINANVKAKDIHKYYGRDRTTISKYLHHIEETVMGNPTLYYNRQLFDLSSHLMIIGKATKPDIIDRIHRVFGDEEFPFRSEVISDGSKLMMVLVVPPTIGPEISYFIWSHLEFMEVNSVSVSHDHSWRYPFYPNNYDTETQTWKVSKSYLIDDVIQELNW